jgi:hypothetical protein
MPIGAFRQSLNLANPVGAAPAGPWTSTLSSTTISSVNAVATHTTAIHGVTNGHLVGTVIYQSGSNAAKTLIPWAYNITTGAFAQGAGVSTITGSAGQTARVAGNGANGMTFQLSGSYTLRGYQITNYASVTTTTLPTITMASAPNVPYFGAGNGTTGQSLSVDRTNGQYIAYARNSGDRSTYRRATYTHPSTYAYPFAGNLISFNGVGQGRNGGQYLLPIPNSSMNITIVDDPNGNNTFANIMGSSSERGFNFYGSGGGFNGQAALISHSGTGNTASATALIMGTAGAAANSYRYRRLSVTNQNTGSFLDPLTTVTLENGLQAVRVYTYKPNTSTDYLVIYRNGTTLYGAKVNAATGAKTEYGAILDNTEGFNALFSSDVLLHDNVVYTANFLLGSGVGKILITKFTD